MINYVCLMFGFILILFFYLITTCGFWILIGKWNYEIYRLRVVLSHVIWHDFDLFYVYIYIEKKNVLKVNWVCSMWSGY